MSKKEALRWTIKKVLAWSKGYLEKHEIDSPRLTAELLLIDILSCSRVDLFLRFEQPLTPDELAGYREHLKRRILHEPTQYILGEQEFWSLPFKVDSRVLIPRPETECLLEEVIELAKSEKLSEDGDFLELCTGSGVIICALASEFPGASLLATDLSKDALEVAQKNAKNLGFLERIEFLQGDLFEPIKNKRYDLIITNPPYIVRSELDGLMPEVSSFEPRMALDGGEDGLDLIRVILDKAPLYLKPGGYLIIEIGFDQGKSLLKLASEYTCFQEAEIRKDYARMDRMLFCRLSSEDI